MISVYFVRTNKPEEEQPVYKAMMTHIPRVGEAVLLPNEADDNDGFVHKVVWELPKRVVVYLR